MRGRRAAPGAMGWPPAEPGERLFYYFGRLDWGRKESVNSYLKIM